MIFIVKLQLLNPVTVSVCIKHQNEDKAGERISGAGLENNNEI